MEFKIGQTVRTNEGREGVIRYAGGLHIATGEWIGLELPDASGKNDGSVKGERYFNCQPGHGIFVREGAITDILEQPVQTASSRANGSATTSATAPRPRPSSGLSADAARRRQSLMSNGSGSVVGSRLSTRSPTKSPSKPGTRPSGSATSSPRTGTPLASAKPPDMVSKSRPSIASRPSLGLQSSSTRLSAQNSRPSVGASSGLRTSTTPRVPTQAPKPTTHGSRVSQTSRSTLRQTKPTENVPAEPERKERSPHIGSPTIDEEVEYNEHGSSIRGIEEILDQDARVSHEEEAPDNETGTMEGSSANVRIVPSSRGNAGTVESRTAQQRETEQLKAKIRTLEKKRQEDRDNLKQVETLRSDKDRYEGIIQALQKKLRSNQQDLIEMRSKCEEAEARANAIPERSGEHESEIELATLDKEMAEERAETFQMELEALKVKHEELELEAEILREENAELASTMSPEEKANAGWLQMERERERLRDALLKLRDMSQENESSLKAEIDELRTNLDEAEKTAGLYVETVDRLSRAEETNKHLMGQLEAAESNDEVVEAMENQREQQIKSIEQLRNQIQDLEEHIYVTEELEVFHIDEEKRLHAQLDENEALLNESYRRNLEQDRIIEDLEYTLTKFRDVVQGLQSDIDELRRSREISEMQANEMSSKSRAMMDLNLRLQNNAAKSQTKFIDIELNKVKAEIESKHVEILELFLPETVNAEQKPILTLLCFGRIRSEAEMVGKILGKRARERSHLNNGEETFKTFDTMEHMEWISATCQRFEKYMYSCDTQQFAACGNALAELEPVERTVITWIEALRKDELAHHEAEHLQRMQGILIDLAEKLIIENMETQSVQILTQMTMVENYAESMAVQLTTITNMVQSRVGPPKSDDEESLVFDKKMDQLATKARTMKYLTGKVVQQLDDNCKNSCCLSEDLLVLFEEAEQAAKALARRIRIIGMAIAGELSKIGPGDSISYADIHKIMVSSAHETNQSNGDASSEPFALISGRLTSLQSLVDEMQIRSSEPNNMVGYESLQAPWIVRAKEIKNTKLISPEVQDELTGLERRNVELGVKVTERERIIEEMGMRIEIAEKRFKESKEKDNKEKMFQDEIESLKSTKQANDKIITNLRSDLLTAQTKVENTQTELEALRSAASGEVLTAAASAAAVSTVAASHGGNVDESLIKQFELEVNLLHAEIASLQAAIRYFREENRSLRTPVSEALIASTKNSWLTPDLTKRKPSTEAVRKSKLEREGLDVWTGLIEVAKNVKPVRLAAPADERTRPSAESTNSWQSAAHTNRYLVLRQREELARWEALRDDFINRARVVPSGARSSRMRTNAGGAMLPKSDGSNLTRNAIHNNNVTSKPGNGDGEVGTVRIVRE